MIVHAFAVPCTYTVLGSARKARATFSGPAPGRERDEEITLFKSVGTALQDLAVAARVYERAQQQGAGLEIGGSPHTKP